MRTFYCLLLLMSASVCAQDNITRFALVNSNIPSGAILKGINENCRDVVLTIDVSRASYTLEAQINKESENRNERTWLTLFDKNGDALFSTNTVGTENAVKDVCNFLKLGKH
ncbi:MAG: hypothetical protein WAL75_03725 [Terracidiphilus sp.]